MLGQRMIGQRIVVTRAVHQAEELAAALRDLGATVILLPTIGIAPPVDLEPLQLAASRCNAYNWILFASVNAIEAFAAELSQPAALCKARIATIGAATREAAERRGFTVSVTPERYVAESLLKALDPADMQGLRVLIPSAAVTREVLAPELRRRGAEVTVVEAYRNITPAATERQAPLVFREPYPDWVTFTSSSAVENLVRITGVAPLAQSKIATIGPVTSETVRRFGLGVAIEAAVHSVPGMVSALYNHNYDNHDCDPPPGTE